MLQFKDREALVFPILWDGDHNKKKKIKKKDSWEDYHNHLITC